jgi:hypothetical protein
MKRIAISLPDDLYAQLEALAQEIQVSEDGQEYRVSMSEIARRAIYDYLNAPYHDDSPLPTYVEQISGKKPRAGGKISGHGGKRQGAGRKGKDHP